MKTDHVDFIQTQWTMEMPGLDTSPMGIIGRISRISRHIDRLLQMNYSKFNLNGGEFDVLASLRRSGHPFQLTPTELFKSMMLSSGAMTNRLDRLEDANLIIRSLNPEDRRGTLVTLTEKGIDLMNDAYPSHIDNETQILSGLTPSEQKEFTVLLRKLLFTFENN